MILADLKTDLGIGDTSLDDYLLKYMINPAVRKATTLSMNIKLTTVTLVNGTQSYDLTSSAVASPVVSDAGVQELIWDRAYPWPYDYKVDFYIKNKTTLQFVDSSTPISGDLKLKYNEFFSDATSSTETDAPEILHPAIKRWALAEYGLRQLSKGLSGVDGGVVEEKSEEGIRIKYGATSGSKSILESDKRAAEIEMIDLGANAKFDFYSIQVI